MEKIVRYFTLSLLLIIPIAVFLFLKNFGENHFKVPVYYQSGTMIEGCIQTGEQHKVAINALYSTEKESIFLCYLPQHVEGTAFYDGLDRIKTKWQNINVIGVVDSNLNTIDVGTTLTVNQELLDIVNCQFVLGQDKKLDTIPINQIILIDHKLRIRGYYQGEILEEIDRLDVEIDILYKEYANETE